jgi:hypothetical protein
MSAERRPQLGAALMLREGALAREQLRRSFRPADVRVFFVGESPPAAGTFFYAADSGLYRATRDAFKAALPSCHGSNSFLTRFAAFGCYLDDLCHEPVNHLTDRRDGSWKKRVKARRDGEPRLAQTLAELQPQVVVILLKGIAKNVARAAGLAGYAEVERYTLTYPSRWHLHRLAYRRELTALVRDLARRGILFLPSTSF